MCLSVHFFAFHLPYGNLHNAQTNHEVTMIKYHKMWLKYYRHVVYFFIHLCIQKHEKKIADKRQQKKNKLTKGNICFHPHC